MQCALGIIIFTGGIHNSNILAKTIVFASEPRTIIFELSQVIDKNLKYSH